MFQVLWLLKKAKSLLCLHCQYLHRLFLNSSLVTNQRHKSRRIMSRRWPIYTRSSVIHDCIGHYFLNISFSSGTFSKVHAGRRPLPLYHYSSTAINVGFKRPHPLWKRHKMWHLWGERSDIFWKETYFNWLTVSLVVPNWYATQNYWCIQNTSLKSTQ